MYSEAQLTLVNLPSNYRAWLGVGPKPTRTLALLRHKRVEMKDGRFGLERDRTLRALYLSALCGQLVNV